MDENSIDYKKIIEDTMTENNMSFQVEHNEDHTLFNCPMSSNRSPGFNLRVRVSDDGGAKIWTYLLSNINEEKFIPMLKTLNKLNDNYRFIKLSIDKDNDVCAEYDFFLFGEEDIIGDQFMSILYLFSDIVDTCLPDILKTVWNE